jgi:hypothetical protein
VGAPDQAGTEGKPDFQHFSPSPSTLVHFIIIQHPVLRALDIVKFTFFYRPEEKQPADATEEQRQEY